MTSRVYLSNINIYKKRIIGNIILFLILFVIFFLYQRIIIHDNLIIKLLVNTLILVIFTLSVCKIKYGIYFFIFLIPLLNSLPTVLGTQQIPVTLFLFFPLILGFIVNYTRSIYERNWNKVKHCVVFDKKLAGPIIVFIIIFTISCLITIFRYANFYPFITNNYYNLKVNINGAGSTDAIFWTVNFFFNYIVGFVFALIIFNIFDDIKDIVKALIITLTSAFLSFIIILYQYFINSYFGNIGHWVSSGRFNATFTDPNSLGVYTILLFPIFLLVIIYFKRWFIRLIFSILFIFFMIMVILSGSKSALLGISIALFIFLIVSVIKIPKKIKYLSKKKKLIILVSAILICIIVISAFTVLIKTDNKLKSIVLKTGLIERTVETSKAWLLYYKKDGFIESIKSISNYRYIYWNRAIQMFKDYPISGVGLSAYVIELPDYHWAYDRGFNKVDYTGNYYLQILAELGFCGLVLTMLIFYLILKKIYFFFRKSKKYLGLDNDNIILIGLSISFISMVVILIFGPHTNFFEIQFIFWLIIGLIITYIRIIENKAGILNKKGFALSIGSKISFNLAQKISLGVIITIFTISFFISSVSNLSINIKQNNYGGGGNVYGFYKEEELGDKYFRWTDIDASESIEKKGSKIVIPLRAGNPDIYERSLFVRVYIDNLLIKVIKLKDDKWHYLKYSLPDNNRERVTVTIVNSRSWIPKEFEVTSDTRELGIMIGDIKFLN